MWSSLGCVLWMLAGSLGAAAVPAETGMPQPVLERAYEELAPAVCVLAYSYEVTNPSNNERVKQDAQSPGLIVSQDGLVMARGHMSTPNIEPFNIRVLVGHGDGTREYPAVLLKKPSSVNIAFLRIQHDGELRLPHVRFKNDAQLRVGEPIAVVGVLPATLDHNPSVVVRRIGSILETPRTTYCLDDAVPSSFVGGPVINAQGEVVGVVGYDLSISEGGDLYVHSGHPLVYQAGLFAKYVSSPPAEAGEAADEDSAWLGVFTQPLTDDLASYWGVDPAGGAVVSTIMPGSPAEAAAFQRGDIIVEFNGMPVKPKHDREVFAFTRMIREAGIGQQVPVVVLRDGKRVDLTVTLAAQPKASGEAIEYEDELFGLTVRELTRDVRILLNLPEDVQGVIVRRIESGSWASLGSVRPGAIILNFGGHRVSDIDTYKEAVAAVAAEKPQEISIFARVGPLTGFFRLEPRWDNETP